MAKKKYYAIAAGRSSGIFTDWPTAEKQVKGFAGAKYKSFPTKEQAEAWLTNPVYVTKERPLSQKNVSTTPQKNDPEAIVVYTDGGSINNPGPGGYGVVIERKTGRSELSGGFRLTTNNRMEMMAAIVALRSLQDCRQTIFLYTDSSYLVNGINKGWARKWRTKGWCKSDGQAVLNIDLWKELLGLLEVVEVRFHWVKGHAGNELNERCDKLVGSVARQSPQEVDVVYETMVNGEKESCDQRTF